METDLLFWNASSAQGFEKQDAATYPTQEPNSGRHYIPYDDGGTNSQEAVVFEGIMPEGYDSDQTIFLDVYYWMESATSGGLKFDAFIEAISPDDAFDLDSGSSFDLANSGTDTVPGTQGYMAVITIAMTNLDTMVAGAAIRLCLERDGTDPGDTAVGDCNVYMIRLYQSTS